MSAFFKIIVTLFFALGLFWIVVANRGAVSISFEPLWGPFSLSMALIIFGSVIFGFLWGAGVVWLNGTKTRCQSRRQIKELKKEIDSLSKNPS